MILTKKFLEEQYFYNKIDVKTIAKNTGFSYPYLQAKIKEYGIPRHRKYHNILGKTFGKLKVIEFLKLDDRQQAWWICECECGNKKNVRASQLKCGDIKSCGCLHLTRCGDISGSHFANIKSRSKWNGRDFDLKIEDIWNLFLKQNKKCALSGEEIYFSKIRGKTTASLDRIDSSKGYFLDNVQWVHKDVNQMKSNRSDEDFLKWIEKIYKFQNKSEI